MFRNFVFTLNNPTDEDAVLIHSSELWGYFCYGEETGENGTFHWQGYMELKKQTRFNTVKKMMPRAHIEHRKGTQEQAIKYCKKGGVFHEFGTKNNQGQRNDLDQARLLAYENGMRMVALNCNYQQIKTAEKYLDYNEEPRDWKPTVIWLYGKPGSGKSRRARELCSDDTYTKNDGNKWWTGYDAHEDVILDDFRDSWWSITETLSLLDRYEKRVEFKGGSRQFKPKRIVITSIFHPKEMYKNCKEEPIQQLLRRIDTIEEVVTNVSKVEGNTISSSTLSEQEWEDPFEWNWE